MDRLETLITEALSKFPSEDIRELVAAQTGLTVEQVSKKMNAVAKARADEFPAMNFALLESGKVDAEDLETRPVGDVDRDGMSDTEADREVAADIVTDVVDSNKDKKITYKVGFVPNVSDYEEENSIYDMCPSDIDFEERTDNVGIKVSDLLENAGWSDVYGVMSQVDLNTSYPAETVTSADFSTVKTFGDIPNFGSLSNFDAFIEDGAFIIIKGYEKYDAVENN
jgi:hypothetical protein